MREGHTQRAAAAAGRGVETESDVVVSSGESFRARFDVIPSAEVEDDEDDAARLIS